MKKVVLIAAYLLTAQPVLSAPKMGLQDYLKQVEEKHEGYKSAKNNATAAKLRSGEGSLLVLPTLSLQASSTIDERPSSNPPATGTKNMYSGYSASISEMTPIGLQAKISYNLNYRNTEGANPTYVPVSQYYTGSPSIEISQSLWRNGFGSETRAMKQAIAAGAQVSHYSQKFQSKIVLLEAHNTYWRLLVARKTLLALRESLEVADKLRDWAQKRVNAQLADQSDYLQTKSAYEVRLLDVSKAVEEEKSAARAFNSLRGLDTDSVSEDLSDPPRINFRKEIFAGNKWRDDVRAAEHAALAAQANSQLGKEKNKPSFDIFASYAYNGLSTDQTTTISDSWKSDKPTYTVGVKFSSPLAWGTASDVREGYEMEQQASQDYFRRKSMEQERDFADLQAKITNAQERLQMTHSLETSQKAKLQQERSRHSRGRTTLFQVLQFEQDYVLAQVNKIRTEAELSTLLNQYQLYQGE